MKLAPFGLLLLTGLALVLLAGCESTPPKNPDPAEVSWITYSDPVVGYSVEVPQSFVKQASPDGPSVLFRLDGFPVLCINVVSREEGKKRGLWVGQEPAGQAMLAGRRAMRYVYRHYDGPTYMRTLSYVVEHQGRELGLEFRTLGEDLDPLQTRILESFRFH